MGVQILTGMVTFALSDSKWKKHEQLRPQLYGDNAPYLTHQSFKDRQ